MIYVDAQIVIYSTDRHPVYEALCRPIWEPHSSLSVVSSELILLETLVGPIRTGNTVLETRRESIWHQADSVLLPITKAILREAARLRASIPALKTPDAIHAATALLHGSALFVSNDTGFKRVPAL